MLSNIDCHHIKVTSELITDYIGSPERYSSLEVSITKNCCSSQTKTQTIESSTTEWSIETLTQAHEGEGIQYGFKIRNIFTGEEYNIGPFNYDTDNCTSGFTNVETEITDWLSARGQSPGPSYSSAVINGKCVFTISNLLFPFAFTKMTYTENGIDKEKQFKYGSSAEDLFISGDSLFISPGIFDLETFGNGIYTVNLTLTETNGSIYTDTQCGFVDCDIKCRIADMLDTLSENTIIHIIYQALVEASNCSCQCDKLCKLYEELLRELGDLPQNSDCGC